ncbi:MAG: TolC family protein [Bacteroidales bacterium]
MFRPKRIQILAVAYILYASLSITAQTSTEMIRSVEDALVKVDSLFNKAIYAELSDVELDTVTIAMDNMAINSWSDAEKESRSAISGLGVNGGYDRKFGDGTDELYDDYYSYDNRLHLMLSWNILSSGLYGKSNYENAIEIQKKRYLIKEKNNRAIELIYAASEQQESVLAGYYNTLYNAKIELYTTLLTFQNYLQENGKATIMERAELELLIAMNCGLIKSNASKIDCFLNLDDYLSMQMEITDAMLDELIADNHIITGCEIESELLANQADGISYWDDATLSPYAKVVHYSGWNFVTESRVNAHVGVSVTLPIYSGNKQKREAVLAKANLLESITQQRTIAIKCELGEVAHDLNKNYQLLKVAIEMQQIYRNKINVAKQMYVMDSGTIQDLSNYYVALLDSQVKVYDLIADREYLKTRLLLLNSRT